MAESGSDATSAELVGGLLVVVGGVVVIASVLWPTVTVGETTVDLYLVGGVVFAVGFALGAVRHWRLDDTRHLAAQLVAAVGWLAVVVGSTQELVAVLYLGLACLLVGGIVLLGFDRRVREAL